MRSTQIIEALLFASDAPLAAAELARASEHLDEDAVEAAVVALRAEYDAQERAFQVYEIAGGYQILTRPEYAPYLERFDTVPRPSRLSSPALEVLAILAYRQPLGRSEIEEIRGVGSAAVLRTLLDRGLIEVVGRGEGLGRPLLYGTTDAFLDHLGLRSLEDLPKPDELPVVLTGRPVSAPALPDGVQAMSDGAGGAAHPPAPGANQSHGLEPSGATPPARHAHAADPLTGEGMPTRSRLQKFLAAAGVASRRGAEALILAGRVAVNGHTVTELGTTVDPDSDRVEVDGRRVAARPRIWIALHKPAGYVTTRRDPQRRPTVYDLLPAEFRSLFHVGRLDAASEGLLLLTNDGDVAHQMLHPRFRLDRVYDVTVGGRVDRTVLDRLLGGVQLEDGMARVRQARLLGYPDSGTSSVRVTLQEGRKREVRRLFAAVGHPVLRLVRRRYGPVELGTLPAGKWRHLTPTELARLPVLEREGPS